MLPIGTFSKISKVSANALRYYDEIGLLKPVHINQDNGYRYYDSAQLETILLINKLKTYHLTLEEITIILQSPENNHALLDLIKQHHQDTRKSLYHLGYALKQMEQDISNLEKGLSIMTYLDQIEVRLTKTEPLNILFIRQEMSTGDYGRCLADLYQTICSQNLTITGPPMTIFHLETDYDPDCYDNEIAIPIKETIPAARQFPGSTCAAATLHGPYTELTSVYAKLQQWVEHHGYAVTGLPYEIYLTDPTITPAEENITEVYFPVRKQ